MQIRPQDELAARARRAAPLEAIAPAVSICNRDVYLVGGTVRDLLLGREFIDVDLAVDGDPSELAAAIGSPSRRETRFGTVSVQRDGYRYDLVRTRSESYARPGALPDVEPAGIGADLSRRDFTVNALALGMAGRRAGELIAADGGLDDLAARRLAVLHDRSFLDDPTRLLRLARYAARLGFSVASRTGELAEQAIAGGALDTVSGARIGNELRLLANEPDPVAAFLAAAELGLPWSLDAGLARRALDVLPEDGRSDLVVLACVLGFDQLEPLGFPAGDRDMIVEASMQAADLARRLADATSNSEIARSVGSAGIETVALAFSHGSAAQSITWLEDLRHRSLDINGADLISHGIPEGPEIGRALARARSALMDGDAPDRDSQLAVALEAGE